MSNVTYRSVQQDPEVRTFIQKSQEMLTAIGYTEHGLRHVGLVAQRSMKMMVALGMAQRRVELTGIAALMHDIGNLVNREGHGQTSALMAYQMLTRMGMQAEEIAEVMSALGNHEEQIGNPVNDVSAALILADKSDVHRSRVSNRDIATFDIHDRVNYAATHSDLITLADEKKIQLKLQIDTSIIAIMEYFEIFLVRMMMSRRAAQYFDCQFELVINDTRLL